MEEKKHPTRQEQRIAMNSFKKLAAVLDQITSENPEIEIVGTHSKIQVPYNLLHTLMKVLKVTGEGKLIRIYDVDAEMSTQAAAEFLGCSRPHLVKLLEQGEIPFFRKGTHRRIRLDDLEDYKKKQFAAREKLLIEIIEEDEDLGLYE